MTKEELQSKIDKLEKSIVSPITNKAFIPAMEKQVTSFKAQLKELEKKTPEVVPSKKTSTGKVKMKEILIHWAEGLSSLADKIKGKKFTSWKDATLAVIPFMPEPDEGYNKVKFTVTFEDGEEYQGRLDLSHTEDNALTTDNIFGKHIKDVLDYELSEKSKSAESTKKEVKEWLEKYDIGRTETKIEKKGSTPTPAKTHTYKLGDKYRSDFDYDGMIKMGSQSIIDWGVDKLTKLHNSFEDMNYHTESKPLWQVIVALKAKDTKKAKEEMAKFHKILKEEYGEKEPKPKVKSVRVNKPKDSKVEKKPAFKKKVKPTKKNKKDGLTFMNSSNRKNKNYADRINWNNPKKQNQPTKKEDRQPSCKELLDLYDKRKASHDKSQNKHKTDSVSDKIGNNIASAISKAMDNVSAEEIKKSPRKYIAKFKEIKKELRAFITKLKPLLGEDFDMDELISPLESVISEHIQNIEKKSK